MRIARSSLAAMVNAVDATAPAITERQRQVVELIAEGCSNEEVGARLGISARTAKAHTDVFPHQIGAARRHIIERPRLTKLLDESTARVILLTAPAGYGKTTLARQWMADKPHVYYECGIESSDVPALALGLATAARTVFPRAETHIR